MPLIRSSPCKVNFVLNLLGRRPDGFHELETLFFPVPLRDELTFDVAPSGVSLTCSHPELPVDGTNLVVRAANHWLAASGIGSGVRMHLEKRLPLAAGLGAGSANAAITLLGLNELFGNPLSNTELDQLAAGLGSDVNFFLQPNPALAFGRGERIQPLAPFPVLTGRALFLFHPGFGVSTPWAFRELADFPENRNGRPGRAAEVAEALAQGDLSAALAGWYNALEAPVLRKYPVLALYQEFLRSRGALGALMSGSGSTTFAMFPDLAAADAVVPEFRANFGPAGWLATVGL
jgi:4-diphosphocytidyl-2-C-methyl-D-erythritol kinase